MEHCKKNSCDKTLLLVLILLIIVGLVLLYSTSAYNGEIKFHDAFYYVKKQLFATSLGIAGMLVASMTDYHFWGRFAWLIYLISVALSLAVIFAGEEYNGSKRWLSVGPLSFQPSEFSKVAIIIFLSTIIVKNMASMGRTGTLIRIMLLIFPVVGLVGASNLSTAIIILGIGGILIFIASPKYRPFIYMLVIGTGFMAVFLGMESYRMERLQIWRNPEKFEKGYQTLQGLFAIGSGGLFGKGNGGSIQKLGFVPEAQNDMIFSIVCEEWGFFGASFLLLLFMALLWRFFVIATKTRDMYGTLIVSGAMVHMSIQVILNIAVVTNTIPNTGITLPFVSYGGTSALFLLFEMGLVLSVSRTMK